MGNFTYNQAKGEVVGRHQRVVNNDPTNSALVLVAINTTESDLVLQRLDTLAQVLANANTAEVTNTNYSRKILTDSVLSAKVVNDVDDQAELDMPDQLFVAIEAGDAWTDIIVCFDPDTSTGDDTTLIPLLQYDFSVNPDGRDIPLEVDADGYYWAT